MKFLLFMHCKWARKIHIEQQKKKPRDETAHQTQLRGKNAEKLPNVQELRHTHCFNDIFKRSL